MPAVRLRTTSTPDDGCGRRPPCRAAGRGRLGRSRGSRTWMWTTAAPASAASIAESAICSRVTGTCGLRAVVSPAPVTAHVMKAFQFTGSIPRAQSPWHVPRRRPTVATLRLGRPPPEAAGGGTNGGRRGSSRIVVSRIIGGPLLRVRQLLIGGGPRPPRAMTALLADHGGADAAESADTAPAARSEAAAAGPPHRRHAAGRRRREHQRHRRRSVHRGQGRPGPPGRRMGDARRLRRRLQPVLRARAGRGDRDAAPPTSTSSG